MEPSQQPSWQAHAKKRGHARLARDLRRTTIVIALLVSSVILAFLLFPPFFAPQTHVVLVGARSGETFNMPPIAYVAEDMEAIAAVEEATVHDQSEIWSSARTAKNFANRLAETGLTSSDNLIVYLTAHGVAENSSAYLLCNNFDLRQPDLGRVSVENLIEQVSQSPAATKLVVLNAGTIDYDPGMGVVGNDFPRLLEKAVHQSNDPSLWVYCSHSSLQYSHVSRAARRSVFGMFVGEGLKGAADLDHDGTIRLGELVGFTSANVSKWVAQGTDRGAKQIPKLIWGGGKSISSDPKLLTLFKRGSKKPLTVAALIRSVDDTSGGATLAPRPGKVQGLVRRQQVTLASNRMLPGGKSGNAGDAGADASVADAPAGEPVLGSDSGGSATETGGAAGDPAAGGKNGSGKGVGDDEAARPKQLLTNAWRLRDESAEAWSADDPNRSPIENKPHLWRELQAELLTFEQRIAGGKGFDSTEIETTLEDSFSASKTTSPTADPPLKTLFGNSSLARNSIPGAIQPDQAHSLALAQLIAMIQGEELTVDIEGLHAALNQSTRVGMDEWLKTRWRREFGGYVELAYLKRLADESELEWDVVQLASQTCFAGERLAALDLWSPDWIREDVDRADQFRFFAEQVLFDQVGLKWQERSKTMLEDANDLYTSAENDFIEVRKTQRLFNVLLARLRSYLKWHHMSKDVPDQRVAIHSDLSSLLGQLKEISGLLDQPGKTSVEGLTAMRIGLESLQSRIESACGDLSAERLLDHTPTPGDSYQADLLLKTPLLTSAMRSELLSAMDQRDRQLASNYDLANVSIDDVSAFGFAGMTTAPSLDDWRFLLKQAQLESQYVGLSQVTGSEDTDLSAVKAGREVKEAFNRFEQAYEGILQAAATPSGPSAELAGAIESLWAAHSKFGVSLQTFFQSAIEAPGSTNTCAASSASSRAAIRLLRMLDARDAWQLANVDVDSLSLAMRMKSTIEWHARRLDQASTYRSGKASGLLADWADEYRTQSELICRLADPSSRAERIAITGPINVDLQYGDTEQVVIGLQNQSEHDALVTVSLDFVRELIEVTPVSVGDNANQTSQQNLVRPQFFDTPSQFGTRRSEPIVIAAGQSIEMPMRIVRRGNASETTKLVVDVFASSSLTRLDLNPPTLLTRQTLDILLPVAEIFVQQGDATFVSDDQGLELLPHPNRLEQFKFGVVNHSSKTKKIAMSCYSLDAMLAGPFPSDPSKLLLTAKPLAKFDVTVPGDGQPSFPSAGDADKADAKEAESKASEPQKEDPPKEEDAAPKPIKSTDITDGMLVVLTDIDTGQSTFRKVHFAVQRPRRFVSPRVGFDTKRQQITIEVSASNPPRLPQGAPVRVECRLADDVSGRTKGKLQGVITKTNPVANLFIAMSTPPPSIARVYLEVDGYPRAFIFDVPCGKHVTNVPEVTDSVDLRMTTSSKNGILGATKSIPVEVRVDAPVGSFENGRDHLSIGIDLDESGVPNPEDSVTLTTDRGVTIGFVKSSPNGVVELVNVVSDHLIDLPAEKLENLFIDVAASLTINDKTQSFRNIELLIDTAAPVVGPVNRTDGLDFVGVNSQLVLNVWAWDEGSDVMKVEAAFDLDESGEFPKAGNIFTGSRTSDREWSLSVDSGADAGKKTLLVRGVDRVGNRSKPVAMELEVVSSTENTKRVEQQTVDLIGSIQWRQKGIAEAEVRLIAIADDPPGVQAAAPKPSDSLAVRSTENGGYLIPGVSPGSYRLAARAVIRNKVHRTEKEVVVTVGPERKMRVDVELP